MEPQVPGSRWALRSPPVLRFSTTLEQEYNNMATSTPTKRTAAPKKAAPAATPSSTPVPVGSKKKSATMDRCEKAVKLRNEGEKISAIQKRTGLNYQQVWGALDYAKCVQHKLLLAPADRTGTKIAQLRDSKRLSWGMIMVQCGWHPVEAKSSDFTLGKVTRLYKEATGNTHEGSRIGHGGAFLLGDIGKALYRGGDRQRTGITIPAGTTRDQILQAIAEGLDERLTKLVVSGKISKATAATRKAAGLTKANKALDEAARAANPVKQPVKKAPAKKVAAGKVAKKVATPTLAQ